MPSYQETHLRSLRDPEGFWAEAAQALHWDLTWDRVLDDTRRPFYRWFPGGLINTCHNALDRHVANGEFVQVPPTIDDPAILDEIAAALTASQILETHATPT